MRGNYRNLGESIEIGKLEQAGEPTKERERFRDKVKEVFKLKSSKSSITLQDNSSDTSKDFGEEFFSANIYTGNSCESNFSNSITI